MSLKSLILIISTKRTKNESTVQRITPRKKRKRTRKIKDMNMKIKLDNIENDVPMEKQKTAYILGDSMVKKLNGYLLTKKR